MNKKWYFVLVPILLVMLGGGGAVWWLLSTNIAGWAERNTGPWLVGAAAIAFGGVLLTVVVQGVIASIGNDHAVRLAKTANTNRKEHESEKWRRQVKYEALMRLIDAASSMETWVLDSDEKKRETVIKIVGAKSLVLTHVETERQDTLNSATQEVIDVMRNRKQGDGEMVTAARQRIVDFVREELTEM